MFQSFANTIHVYMSRLCVFKDHSALYELKKLVTQRETLTSHHSIANFISRIYMCVFDFCTCVNIKRVSLYK